MTLPSRLLSDHRHRHLQNQHHQHHHQHRRPYQRCNNKQLYSRPRILIRLATIIAIAIGFFFVLVDTLLSL